MNIDDLIGRLTDAMRIESGGSPAAPLHPPALADSPLAARRGCAGGSAASPRARAIGVAPALEVVDSRYRDFRFSLADVIADNSSSAAFVVGPWQSLPEDLTQLGIRLCFDGLPLETGSAAAIMGDPLLSLTAAARLAADAGVTLEPGWLVMAGGATAARPLKAGVRVSAEVESLGRPLAVPASACAARAERRGGGRPGRGPYPHLRRTIFAPAPVALRG
jgi:2-oxo-3-hexenedioate decarboxylase